MYELWCSWLLGVRNSDRSSTGMTEGWEWLRGQGRNHLGHGLVNNSPRAKSGHAVSEQQWHSRVATAETVWPDKPKPLTLWSFTEILCQPPRLRAHPPHDRQLILTILLDPCWAVSWNRKGTSPRGLSPGADPGSLSASRDTKAGAAWPFYDPASATRRYHFHGLLSAKTITKAHPGSRRVDRAPTTLWGEGQSHIVKGHARWKILLLPSFENIMFYILGL